MFPATQSPAMTDSASFRYWRETPARVKQLWYTSFCLMMSSVQDRLTGLALRETGNLNWATTASYYSAVHAGRLVCFVCAGDYPTGHADLSDLLAPREARTSQRPRRIHLDWLGRFRRYVESRRTADDTRLELHRCSLIAAIDATLPGVRATFDQFAPLLTHFKNLRNDCNYEALLIAHERNHTVVTDGFNELAEAAQSVSNLAADLAVTAYSEHLKQAECFHAERERFHAAHSAYLTGRFAQSLGDKFQGSGCAMDELHRIQARLEWPGTPDDIDVGEFLAPIMYETFGEKRGLMTRWRQDIGDLQRALPQDPGARGNGIRAGG